MKISVICPTYNSINYLKRLILNLNQQTFTDFELIIVDDCSNDETFSYVKDIIETKATIFQIKLIVNEKNLGVAISRNRAIEKADGEYIAFIDVDDLWMKTKLEVQYSYMEKEKYALTYTYFLNYDEKNNVSRRIKLSPKKLKYIKLLFSNRIRTSSVMYSVKQIGKQYFPDIRKRQDYALWLLITQKYDNCYLLPEFLLIYSIAPNSLSRSSKFKLIKFHWKVFREHLNMGLVTSSIYTASNTIFNGVIYKIIQRLSKKVEYDPRSLY